MGDYFQNGPITTLHDFGLRSSDELDADLVRWGKSRPMSLIVPSLYRELGGTALDHLVDELAINGSSRARVQRAVPDAFEQIVAAVAADNGSDAVHRSP